MFSPKAAGVARTKPIAIDAAEALLGPVRKPSSFATERGVEVSGSTRDVRLRAQ